MASILKVDTIQDQDGNNIINESANTITIGASGDTITIPSGATLANSGIITGFESTGIDDNATSTAITIDSSERVGIGTASPISALDVNGIINIVDTGWLRFGDKNTLFSSTSVGGLIIQSPTAGSENIIFRTSTGTERMRINSSGNVGIGTSSPTQALDVVGSITATGNLTSLGIDDNATSTAITINSNEQVEFIEGTASLPSITKSGNTDTGIFFPRVYGEVSISSQGNEVMRLNDSGQAAFLKDDFNAAGSSTNRGFEIRANGVNGVVLDINIKDTTTSTIMEFNNPNGTAGTIQLNGTATAYNTSSDYRLKENVNYDFDATTRLKQLKPARFNFIADDTKIVDGFIAHEVSSVVPEAISGEKDALQVWQEGEKLPEGVSVGDNKLDENGNTIIEVQGIDQSKLVPLLVKTIQELEARITALETTTP